MIELCEAETFLTSLSTTRVAGDMDALMTLFHDDAIFAVVGLGEPVNGKAAIHAAVQDLTDSFEFLEWRKLQSVVSNNEIAVRHYLKVRHRPSGTVAETATAEFITLRDGRCSSFIQYADTALVAALGRT